MGFLYFTLLTEPSLTWFTWKELSGAWFTPYVELFVQFQKIRSVVRNFYDISNGNVCVFVSRKELRLFIMRFINWFQHRLYFKDLHMFVILHL